MRKSVVQFGQTNPLMSKTYFLFIKFQFHITKNLFHVFFLFLFLPQKLHSCSLNAANTSTCVIKPVNQLPIQHSPQIHSVRQEVSQLGQTREQLAATFNLLTLPGFASTLETRVSAKCCMWQDGATDGQSVPRERGEGGGTGHANCCSKRSSPTNLRLSVLKSLVIIALSLRSCRAGGGKV